MRYPKHLPQGGKIGFLAPSFGCATEPYRALFDHAQEKWKGMGYRLLPGPNCYASEGVGISNLPEKCGAEVMEMFGSDADCLISCGGGELMCEILPYVDFEKLSVWEPKWFMGYSDNTNLTYLLATLTDTASVYGPCAASFGMEPWHRAISDAFELLTGERNAVASYGMWEKESLKSEESPFLPYNLTEPLALRCYGGNGQPGCKVCGAGFTDSGQDLGRLTGKVSFRGRLLGGCMDCLVNLLGTRFDRTKEFVEKYKEDGIIWFLESCDLNVFSIRRAMWQMEEAGWFQYVKGFLIGRPANGDPVMGLDGDGAVLEVAGRKQVPVVMGMDLGHLPPAMPLVTGSVANVTVDVSANTMEIQMEYR